MHGTSAVTFQSLAAFERRSHDTGLHPPAGPVMKVLDIERDVMDRTAADNRRSVVDPFRATQGEGGVIVRAPSIELRTRMYY